MPRVSVIIPAYNAARYLPDSIDSVVAQSYSDWEAIVIDDGSTDSTPEVVGAFADSLGDRLVHIRQSNRGLPAARNTGVRHSRGEFIALLDADDVWLPDRLAHSVRALDEDPAVGLVHARIARMDTNGKIVDYPKCPRKYLSGHIAHHIFTRRAHLAVATIQFRKSCLSEVGLFDETMRAVEDRDLWFRIAERYEIGFIDEVLAHFRFSPGQMSSDLERMTRGQLAFVNKHRQRGACTLRQYHQALASIYRERGDALIGSGKIASSVACYGRAVLNDVSNVPNVYMFGKACLELAASAVRGSR
jgi:glycosyltransferase involved in cell wall biosynthesis